MQQPATLSQDSEPLPETATGHASIMSSLDQGPIAGFQGASYSWMRRARLVQDTSVCATGRTGRV